MNGKNKNYNSIIFLTTLSVYLGLVLVGGSPQVLAYAATTRNFDIQHEIEFKDDLDNKPDNETFAELKTKIDEQDQQFIKQYAQFLSSSLKNYYSSEVGGYEILCSLQGEINKVTFPSLDGKLAGLSDFKADKPGLVVKFDIKSNSKNVNLAKTFSIYTAGLDFYQHNSKNQPEKVIYENTKITFENDQIFIVTNLPRAGIDSLTK